MGGAPWTSTGCENCKKSKVKCDMGKPQCGRCVKRNIPCPGYRGRLFFQQIFTHTQPGSSRSPESEERKTIPGPAPIPTPERSHTVSPTSIASPETRNQISSSYVNSWFPTTNLRERGMDICYPIGDWYWIYQNFLQVSSNSPLLERALFAVSAISLGKLHRDDALLHSGIVAYNDSIRIMLDMIQQNALSEDVLFATVTFQMIEVVHCPHGLGTFLSHVDATNRLLERLYTKSSTPLMNTILNNQRKLVISSSAPGISSPKGICPLLLEVPELESSSSESEVFQLLAAISYIRCQAEDIQEPTPEKTQSILAACLAQKQKMLTWYYQRKEALGCPSLASSSESLSTDLPPATHLFGTPYSFPGFESARTHMLFWGGLLSLEDMIQEINIMTHHANFENGLSEFYADEICRSIPYFLTGRRGAWGTTTLVTFMIPVVRPYIRLQRKEKFEHCQNLFQILADYGVGMASGVSATLLEWWKSYSGVST
ncbi:hypothetical protein N7488_012385 [Penicillium malachiteum]|nr:hypothetical protein N7488_012385 [Penicillium malachiteum]